MFVYIVKICTKFEKKNDRRKHRKVKKLKKNLKKKYFFMAKKIGQNQYIKKDFFLKALLQKSIPNPITFYFN